MTKPYEQNTTNSNYNNYIIYGHSTYSTLDANSHTVLVCLGRGLSMCNVQSKHLHVEAWSDLDFEDTLNFRKLFILEVSKHIQN